jgi:hypothetical protein
VAEMTNLDCLVEHGSHLPEIDTLLFRTARVTTWPFSKESPIWSVAGVERLARQGTQAPPRRFGRSLPASDAGVAISPEEVKIPV